MIRINNKNCWEKLFLKNLFWFRYYIVRVIYKHKNVRIIKICKHPKIKHCPLYIHQLVLYISSWTSYSDKDSTNMAIPNCTDKNYTRFNLDKKIGEIYVCKPIQEKTIRCKVKPRSFRLSKPGRFCGLFATHIHTQLLYFLYYDTLITSYKNWPNSRTTTWVTRLINA